MPTRSATGPGVVALLAFVSAAFLSACDRAEAPTPNTPGVEGQSGTSPPGGNPASPGMPEGAGGVGAQPQDGTNTQ